MPFPTMGSQLVCCTAPPPLCSPSPRGTADTERSWRDGDERPRRCQCAEDDGGGRLVLLGGLCWVSRAASWWMCGLCGAGELPWLGSCS